MALDGNQAKGSGLDRDPSRCLKSLHCFRKDYIQQAMKYASDDEQKAAQILGITPERLRLLLGRLENGQ